MKFRKKPVVIDAVHWGGTNVAEIREFFGPFLDWTFIRSDDGIAIDTLEGTLRASNGNWIIEGTKGEFYPCKPDIFEAIYTPAEATDAR